MQEVTIWFQLDKYENLELELNTVKFITELCPWVVLNIVNCYIIYPVIPEKKKQKKISSFKWIINGKKISYFFLI